MMLCSVLSRCPTCDSCGTSYIRAFHPEYNFNYPRCPSCSSVPKALKIRKSWKGEVWELRFDRKGRRIRNLGEAHQLAQNIQIELERGDFDILNYRRKHDLNISDTIDDLYQILRPKMPLSDYERDLLDDYVIPFLADVGIFVLSPIHLFLFTQMYHSIYEEHGVTIDRLFESLLTEAGRVSDSFLPHQGDTDGATSTITISNRTPHLHILETEEIRGRGRTGETCKDTRG